MNSKPLGAKAYGHIAHISESQRGPADKGLSYAQSSYFTVKKPSRRHTVHVQVKLDGTCVAVANIGGQIIPLQRAGYPVDTSPYTMHRYFGEWVKEREDRFANLLREGERACGEWLMEAHGTRYDLKHEPFVLFDIMQGIERQSVWKVVERAQKQGFTTPYLLHTGEALPVPELQELLKTPYHGELDPVEGAVFRMEKQGEVKFLGKYVQSTSVAGRWFSRISGLPTYYNWKPVNFEP